MPSRNLTSRPRCEWLEPRVLLTTFSVTTVADWGPGSLRQAIADANATADADVVVFAITTGTGGVKTISPTSALPPISAPLTIDGTTQPGYAGTPLVELDGASVVPAGAANGLNIKSPATGSVVRGLAIERWSVGIISAASQCLIEHNFIGT